MQHVPSLARPVIAILRRDVETPTTLPILTKFQRLRWQNDVLIAYCPMGLHPLSSHHLPSESVQFNNGVCTKMEVLAFVKWWDHIRTKDALAAMIRIWPNFKEYP